MGLTADEIAFFDALATNESAVVAMENAKLKMIAGEIISTIRKNATIDLTLRDSVRAKMRVIVRRILARFKYPPDRHEEVVKTVISHADLICADLT